MPPSQLKGSQYIKPRKSSGLGASLRVGGDTADRAKRFRTGETLRLAGRICGRAAAFRGMTAAAREDGGAGGAATVLAGFLVEYKAMAEAISTSAATAAHPNRKGPYAFRTCAPDIASPSALKRR